MHRDEAAIRALTQAGAGAGDHAGHGARGHRTTSRAITDDMERAHEFLQAALGLRLVKKTVNQDDARHAALVLGARTTARRSAPHSALTLFGWPRSD